MNDHADACLTCFSDPVSEMACGACALNATRPEYADDGRCARCGEPVHDERLRCELCRYDEEDCP